MQPNKNTVRRTLELRLEEALPTRGLRESIYIMQVADPVDVTQQAAERELATRSIDRSSVLVRRLRSALDRVDDGSYGICLDCGDEIAPKRLQAIPWAELCIRCQERADRGVHGGKSSRSDGEFLEAA